MKNYIIKNQITNKIIGESDYIEDATSIAIEYIKQHLNDMKRGRLPDINEISKIYIYKGNDGSGKQVYSQELQNFKASNNILTVSGENDNANIFFNNSNDNNDNDSEEKEENTSMKDINYNAFDMNNNWDEVSTTLNDEFKNNVSIFNENYENKISDDVLRDYFNDVDKGYGYVTLSKMRDDLDYIYNIQLSESDVKELCSSNNNLCNIFEIGGIEVVLTKSAPSFDVIAKDLGLTEGVDYDDNMLDEEIQPDQKYPVKSPISESTQELTEKNWEYKIPVNIVKDLADASDVGDLNGMSNGLIKCYKWISENVPDFYSDIDFEDDEEYLSGLKVEYFEDEDELEEEIDGAINAFYDLCDAFNIWVPNYADIAIEDESKELEEDTNINIDKVEIDIDELDNEYNKVDDEASCCNYDDSFDYDRDEFKNDLLKDEIEEAKLSDEEKFEREFEKLDIKASKYEQKSERCFEKGDDEGGYYWQELADEVRREMDMMLATRPEPIDEEIESDQKYPIKSPISENVNEVEEKWNIGSDKSNINDEEMSKLEELAKMLQDNSPNNYKYTVEKTYEDFGAGMQWYTIICHDRSGDSWQVLNTKEWLDLMNNTSDVNTIYNEVINGKYFQDKKQKGKIDLWRWDI